MRLLSKATVFTAVALAAMLPLTVYAEPFSITDVPGQKKIDVSAKYEDSSTVPTVYKVDIEWGSMEFTYQESGTNEWDPSTHQYTLSSAGSWSAAGNTLTVTNHSNAGVTADLSFASAPDYNLTGVFDNSTISLPTAVNTAVEEAPAETVTLTLTGSLPASVTDFSTVGQITVSLE